MGQQEPGGLPELETVPGHVEEEQAELFDTKLLELEAGKPGSWTEQDLRILGENVRDYLRKIARRAVAAFVAGGVESGDAKLYVSEDLQQVAAETWTAPEGRPPTGWRRRGGDGGGGAAA